MKIISEKALIFLAAVMIALGVIGVREISTYINRKAWEAAADVVYPTTNRNIDWMYAGKGGAGR